MKGDSDLDIAIVIIKFHFWNLSGGLHGLFEEAVGGGLLMPWLVDSCFSREGVVISVGFGVVLSGVGGSGEMSEVLPLGFSPVSWGDGSVCIGCCCCMSGFAEDCLSCRVWSWSSVALA